VNSVRLYYIKYDGEDSLVQIDKAQQSLWLSELSEQKKAAVKRLVNNSDRIASLLGMRLLKMCAQDDGVEDFRLSDIQYPKSGKPVWQSKKNHAFDFNISHSVSMAVAATSKTVQAGVDVEKIRALKNLNFKMVLSTDELKQISETPELFFDLWSKKEAVVKAANTVGLARMRDVALNGDLAVLDEVTWHLKRSDLNDQYVVNLATSEPVDELIIKVFSIDELR
jgi:4'-phosphopantetheinyl transferase